VDGKQPPHTRIPDMAAHYIKEIRELQPTGPYFIGGRSLGGIIAFEMACQLRAQGQEVGLLVLLDSYPVGYAKMSPDAGVLRSRVGRIARRIGSHLSNMQRLPLQEKLLYVVDKARYGPTRIKSQVWRTIYRSYKNLSGALPRALCDVQEFNWLAAHDYVPQIYDGRVTLLWASGDLRGSFDLVAGWRALAEGGMEVREIPGTHLNIIKEPHVAELALKLNESLVRAQGMYSGVTEIVTVKPAKGSTETSSSAREPRAA
jgi:thioesterase domain-containing protein